MTLAVAAAVLPEPGGRNPTSSSLLFSASSAETSALVLAAGVLAAMTKQETHSLSEPGADARACGWNPPEEHVCP